MGQKLRAWKTTLPLELNCDKPVYLQIAEGIVNEIKKGRLKPNAPLPGTRQLADDLNVNRKTIIAAYEDLIAEGWLTTALKKGTFVSEKLPASVSVFRKEKVENAITSFFFKSSNSSVPQFVPNKKDVIVFDDGLPDVRLAPMNELIRAYKRIFHQNTRWGMMGYGDPRGSERLRKAISSMLNHDRGLNAETDSLCITRGSQMALYLTAHVLIQKGDWIGIEDPGYSPAWNTFINCGAKLLPLKVDAGGMCIENLERVCQTKKLKAIYVTPHHQFPTTVSMKIDRRLKLIELSNRYGFAIIEDDYDHEFHFTSKSLLPIASQELSANVIYISSLSKIVAPAVRIGYIKGPPGFINSIAALRRVIDVQGDIVMEHAIAELMEEGAILRHARKAYSIYKDRWAYMEETLLNYLGNKIKFIKPEGGLAYWIEFIDEIDTNLLAKKLLSKGVSVIPTEPFSVKGKSLNALRLGYASLTGDELKNGLSIIAKSL